MLSQRGHPLIWASLAVMAVLVTVGSLLGTTRSNAASPPIVDEWNETGPKPASAQEMFVVSGPERVYLAAVNDSSRSAVNVWSAPIAPDGEVGTYALEGVLNTGNNGFGGSYHLSYLAIAGNCLYAMPSDTSSGGNILPNQVIEYAQINAADGHLITPSGASTPFVVDGESFVTSRRHGSALVAGQGYLYAIGGFHVTGRGDRNLVEFSAINADCSLAGWAATAPMAQQQATPRAVSDGSHIWVVGGERGDTGAVALNTVERATIDSGTGQLTWHSEPTLQNARYTAGVALHDGYLVAAGGQTNTVGAGFIDDEDTVETAYINGDGSLDPWTFDTPLPNPISQQAMTSVAGEVYMVGGYPTINGTRIGPVTSGLTSLPDDRTPPVVTPLIGGIEGNNGWYISDVTVDWMIEDPESAPWATDFSATWPTSHSVFPNQAVTLIDLSFDTSPGAVGPTDWLWDFGDNNTASGSPQVSHDYAMPGLYDVTLTTVGGTHPGSVTKTAYVEVFAGYGSTNALAAADFVAARCNTSGVCSSSGRVGTAPFTVEFDTLAYDNTGSSATITSWSWDFGDGGSSGSQHPNHTYANPGVYTVSLTTSGTNVRSETKEDYIVVLPVGGPITTSGCESQLVDYDTTGVTFTCEATSAGGTTTESVTIKRDATDPSQSGAPVPLANANGWNNTNVTVTFTCTDATSGVDTVDGPILLTGEGPNQSATGTCTDLAGNEATDTIAPINIDKTDPSVTGSRSPTANVNGWNNTDVTVSFACTDATSGVDTVDGPVVLSTDGAGQSATGSCTDLAGNESDDTVSSINIDQTDPVVTGSRSPSANANDWNNTDVTVSFACTDATSGVDTVDGPVVLSTDGAGQSATGSCTDLAGNESDDTVSSINIDQTDPVVTAPADITIVRDSSTVDASDPAIVAFLAAATATDDLSGVDTFDNDAPASFPVGPRLVTFTAVDFAGNVGTDAATVTVVLGCNNLVATIVGTEGDDDLVGTSGADVIVGLGGNDEIEGKQGDDTLCGGAGDDEIEGDYGLDYLSGGDGDDELDGNQHADVIDGGAGDDDIEGGFGADIINGGDGNDTIDGNQDADVIDGGAGHDEIEGGFGADIINGGDGNDTIDGNQHADVIDGGAGVDTIDAGTGDDIVTGGSGNDSIEGDLGADDLDGGTGDDLLDGGSGSDTLTGGDGTDTCDGGSGTDTAIACETEINVP